MKKHKPKNKEYKFLSKITIGQILFFNKTAKVRKKEIRKGVFERKVKSIPVRNESIRGRFVGIKKMNEGTSTWTVPYIHKDQDENERMAHFVWKMTGIRYLAEIRPIEYPLHHKPVIVPINGIILKEEDVNDWIDFLW